MPCSLAAARRRRVKRQRAATKSVKDGRRPRARGRGLGPTESQRTGRRRCFLARRRRSNTQKIYVDRQFFASYEDQVQALTDSKTVYIGNLSFYTTEAQIVELCSRTGP